MPGQAQSIDCQSSLVKRECCRSQRIRRIRQSVDHQRHALTGLTLQQIAAVPVTVDPLAIGTAAGGVATERRIEVRVEGGLLNGRDFLEQAGLLSTIVGKAESLFRLAGGELMLEPRGVPGSEFGQGHGIKNIADGNCEQRTDQHCQGEPEGAAEESQAAATCGRCVRGVHAGDYGPSKPRRLNSASFL